MPKTKKEKAPPGPDDLVRAAAGEYTSGDGRFTVRQSDATWYVVDNEQSNEFGQELIHGPFPTLAKAREAIAGARSVKPLLRSAPRPKKSAKSATATITEPRKPPPPPPTWLDKLPADQASEARRLIRALEKEGVENAEEAVRRDRDSYLPAAARALLELRLREIVDSVPESDRMVATDVLKKVTELLTEAGVRNRHPLPGWELVVSEARERDRPRRINLS